MGGGREGDGDGGQLTPVKVGLLRELVLRVAVSVDGVIQLLVGKERQDEIVVRLEQAPEPLLVLHMMNLPSVRTQHPTDGNAVTRT